MSKNVHDKILDYYKTNTLVKHDDALIELLCVEIDKNKKLKSENEKLRNCVEYYAFETTDIITVKAVGCLEELNSFSKTIVEKEEKWKLCIQRY